MEGRNALLLIYVCFVIEYIGSRVEILLSLKDSKGSNMWQSNRDGLKKMRNGRETLKKKLSVGFYEISKGRIFQGLVITCSRRLEVGFFPILPPQPPYLPMTIQMPQKKAASEDHRLGRDTTVSGDHCLEMQHCCLGQKQHLGETGGRDHDG